MSDGGAVSLQRDKLTVPSRYSSPCGADVDMHMYAGCGADTGCALLRVPYRSGRKEARQSFTEQDAGAFNPNVAYESHDNQDRHRA